MRMQNRYFIVSITILMGAALGLSACSSGPQRNAYQDLACKDLRQIQSRLIQKASLLEGPPRNELALAIDRKNLSSDPTRLRSRKILTDKNLTHNKDQIEKIYKKQGC